MHFSWQNPRIYMRNASISWIYYFYEIVSEALCMLSSMNNNMLLTTVKVLFERA